MQIEVKLYATLMKYAPSEIEVGESFSVNIESPTLRGLISHFGFDESEAAIIMVNGIRIDDINHTLQEDDLVVIFPPIGGG